MVNIYIYIYLIRHISTLCLLNWSVFQNFLTGHWESSYLQRMFKFLDKQNENSLEKQIPAEPIFLLRLFGVTIHY